jgi:hypothetical protein
LTPYSLVFPLFKIHHLPQHFPPQKTACRADLDVLVVPAVQFIPSGEEILSSYFDAILHTHQERQDYMREAYHFHCDCPACSLEAEAREASDQRRARISDLKDVIEGWYQEIVEPEEALAVIEEAIDLYEKEGYNVSYVACSAVTM